MWMNSSDIDNCQPRTTVLAEGAKFLRAFRNLIDEISDGWHSWMYGTKCSDNLQALLQTAWCDQQAVTMAQVRAAELKVLKFLKRCRQTRDKPRVQAFLLTWS